MVRQRQTKTEAKIKAAFTTLVKNKGFDAMTVSDLAREADINRGTFYMHYVDKFDLRDQLLDDVIADLAAILIPESDDDNEPLDVEDIIKSRNLVSAMRYLKRDYAFFDAISSSGNDMQLYERVKDVIKQLLLGQVSRLRKAPDDTPGIPREYAMEILVSSTSSILWLWLRRGCQESPETISGIIERSKSIAPVDILR
ncbi:TetR/AcrR family transcriptional regulator [Bifidobacterium dentium]|uniref:TetR/AcrR family transcriptional regulator n=1 Tax=Bifidobacterium dentium TaxID=1689 RepID=UPI00079838F8|nr:TetR/AcrR family transcriptional regulator [Bifidobacterium dentium]KXS22775.1 MAG: TetR family transcriptional regulator [Bifidobacterium dentium]MCK6131150.1 TetR/AcrR family transcriptional regulator [Bifidobacterium dentium]QTL77052.1 TetR/AcrR family transcriptional regulator [Bifidobacterium dentium]HBJ52400.1 TetR/AcrR family transcriptional regulator [Bifidobacterium dentium]